MLYETYRPRDWPEVVGQDKAIKTLSRLESKGKLGGKAYWITGKSGTGKTTIARIIALKLADPLNIYEIDAGEVTLARVAQWATDQHYIPMGERQGRVYILNESHGLRKDVVRSLNVLLEELREYTTFVFTTTLEGQTHFEGCQMDSAPFMSRTIPIRLASMGLAAPFAKRMQEIAIAEGMDGQPIDVYRRWFKDNGLNLRAAIQHVELGGMLV